MKKERTWNQKARKCSQCPQLKPLKDKKTGNVDFEKKLCEKFGWEIANDLAQRTAVCRIETGKRRRLRKR